MSKCQIEVKDFHNDLLCKIIDRESNLVLDCDESLVIMSCKAIRMISAFIVDEDDKVNLMPNSKHTETLKRFPSDRGHYLIDLVSAVIAEEISRQAFSQSKLDFDSGCNTNTIANYLSHLFSNQHFDFKNQHDAVFCISNRKSGPIFTLKLEWHDYSEVYPDGESDDDYDPHWEYDPIYAKALTFPDGMTSTHVISEDSPSKYSAITSLVRNIITDIVESVNPIRG